MNNLKRMLLLLLLAIGLAMAIAEVAIADNTSSKLTYDWTGVYVGGFLGGASGANVTSSEPYNSQTGYWNNSGLNNNYTTNASFMGGVTVGYNWQISKTAYLVGLEGEYGYLGMSGSNPDPNSTTFNKPPGVDAQYTDNAISSTKIGNSYGYGLIGGRIGYTFERTLLYVKSGAVFTSNQSSYDDSNWDVSSSSKRNNDVSYAIGGGVEFALPFEWSKNISVKTEYLYFGINRTTTSSFSSAATDQVSTPSNTSINGIHTAKIGVNYKF